MFDLIVNETQRRKGSEGSLLWGVGGGGGGGRGGRRMGGWHQADQLTDWWCIQKAHSHAYICMRIAALLECWRVT